MSTQQNATIEAIADTVTAAASKATYTGAGTVGVGWLMSSEAAILIGLVLAVGGFVVNLLFSIRRDRREMREHEKKMREMDTTK